MAQSGRNAEKNSKDVIVDEPANPVSRNDDGFCDLMRRMGEGSEDAAWEFYQRYGGHVRRAVRRAMHRRLRPQFDSVDFAQLAWKSFFRMRDEAYEFESPQHAVKYLMALAKHKVQMEVRRQLSTQKHDLGREVPLGCSPGREGEQLATRQPGPVDMAIAHEQMKRLLQDKPPHYRRIIELKLEGHDSAEIGRILDLDAQTVRRFLKRLYDAINV